MEMLMMRNLILKRVVVGSMMMMVFVRRDTG